MDDLIVLHKGIWWTKNDGDGVSETGAGRDSCCYDLTMNQPNEPANISAFVPNKRIMVQAGGNVGFFTKQYADIFDLVYTFEPDPLLFYCLNRNVQQSNVIKFQAAVGDVHRCIAMGRKAASNNAGSLNVVGGGTIPMLLIDDLNLPGCDLIHLDVEGYEGFAVKGAMETIKKYKPVLSLEIAGWEARYGMTPQDIYSQIVEVGYKYVTSIDVNAIFIHDGITSTTVNIRNREPVPNRVFSALKF